MKLYTLCWADTLTPLLDDDPVEGWPGIQHQGVGSKDAVFAALDKTKELAAKYFPFQHAKYIRRGLVVCEVKFEVVK